MNNSELLAFSMPELTKIAVHKHFGYSIKNYYISPVDLKLYVVLNDDSVVTAESLTKKSDNAFVISFKDDVDFLWHLARSKRDLLLQQSDWAMVSDAATDKQAWKHYRQKLRDITKDFAHPQEIIYPEPPNK